MNEPVPDLRRRAAIAAALMGLTALGSQRMVPTRHLAAMRKDFKLTRLVPASFAGWQEDRHGGLLVNPQATALLDKVYSQLLERSYVDAEGARIMLSIAYSADQSDVATQVHYPEVCYPAQGFQVTSNRRDVIPLPQGSIQVRRLTTVFAKTRHEPVTYWTLVGTHQSLGSWDKKLAEIRHGLKGEIVDGLLFRVSSITADVDAGFALQSRFIAQMVAAMTPEARLALAGLEG